ncbi:UNVERIFIED_CONTAM: preprotein translocase subunit YajC [Acetivibrio alkalicellulosi]
MPEAFEGLGFLTMPIIFIGAMYFFVMMPQKKRDRRHREMIDSLKVGDNVVTVGGVVGKIINIKDDEFVVETSVEKTQVKIKKWAIRDVEQLEQA